MLVTLGWCLGCRAPGPIRRTGTLGDIGGQHRRAPRASRPPGRPADRSPRCGPDPPGVLPLVPLGAPPSCGCIHFVHARLVQLGRHRILRLRPLWLVRLPPRRDRSGPLRLGPARLRRGRGAAAGPDRRAASKPAARRPARRRPPSCRRASRPARSEPRPTPVSELELALTASLDAPPGPADFAGLRLPPPLLTGLAAARHHQAVRDPGQDAARRPRRPRHARPGRDRLRQDAGLRHAAARPARRRSTYAPPPARPGAGADPRAGRAGARRPRAARPPIDVRVSPSSAARRSAGRSRAMERGVDLLVATPGRLSTCSTAMRSSSTTSRSPCSTRPTTWPTSASCPSSPTSSTMTGPAVSGCCSRRPSTGASTSGPQVPDRPGRCTRIAPAPSPCRAMDHRAFEVRPRGKVDGRCAQIAARPARTLFFVRTKHGADRLATQLTKAGTPAVRHPRQPAPVAAPAGARRLLAR